MSAVALAVAGMTSSATAQVTGKATLDGPAPKPKVLSMTPQCQALHGGKVLDEAIVAGEKGELKNVVVYVKDGAKLGGSIPKEPVVLDQVNCVYTPHVVAVMIGQELKAKNSDPFLHNVHGLSKDNPEFNFPQQQQGQVDPIKGGNQAVETYKVKCDVHPWMSAWVVVLDHPFSSVTGDSGEFSLKDLKDGKHTLVAWHERLGTQEAEVEVKDGKAAAPVEFKFTPKKPKAAADVVKEAKEVVATVSKPAEEACAECDKGATLVKVTEPAKTAAAVAPTK
jgi:plastocyanin